MRPAQFIKLQLAVALFFVCSAGCSTLGLTLWPSQFPILSTAKEYAEQSPMPGGLNHELDKQVLPHYFVEPGDRLLIEPVELDSKFQAVGDQEVKVDGSVDLGRFGRIRVAGMTVEAIELAIANQIADIAGQPEAVNVQLLEANASKIYVLGAVGSPGSYDLAGRETVLDAIMKAGGLTSMASPCDIIMVRPTGPCDRRVVQRVCYRQITQLGDVSSNYQLQPGDRIVVGQRTLCEELRFWKQTTACPCCERSRGVECQPAKINYANSFARWMLPFARPVDEAPTVAAGTSAESAAELDGATPARDISAADAAEYPLPARSQPALESNDREFFLPPALPRQEQSIDSPGSGSPAASNQSSSAQPASSQPSTKNSSRNQR